MSRSRARDSHVLYPMEDNDFQTTWKMDSTIPLGPQKWPINSLCWLWKVWTGEGEREVFIKNRWWLGVLWQRVFLLHKRDERGWVYFDQERKVQLGGRKIKRFQLHSFSTPQNWELPYRFSEIVRPRVLGKFVVSANLSALGPRDSESCDWEGQGWGGVEQMGHINIILRFTSSISDTDDSQIWLVPVFFPFCYHTCAWPQKCLIMIPNSVHSESACAIHSFTIPNTNLTCLFSV